MAALTSLAVPALAQDAPAAGADTPPPPPNTQLTANPTQTNPTQAGGWYRWDDGQPRLWNVQAELSYWYVALSGDVTMPGSASDEVSFDDLNLDSAEGALMAELIIPSHYEFLGEVTPIDDEPLYLFRVGFGF